MNSFSGITRNSSFMILRVSKLGVKTNSWQWRNLSPIVQRLLFSRSAFTRYGNGWSCVTVHWPTLLCRTGIASRWMNSNEPSNGPRKCSLENATLEIVSSSSSWSLLTHGLVSSHCGVVHQIRCTATCSTGKTRTRRSTTANTGAGVKGQCTHWRDF